MCISMYTYIYIYMYIIYSYIHIGMHKIIYLFMYASLGTTGSTTSGLRMVSPSTIWPLRRRASTAFCSLANVTKAVMSLP